MSLSDEERVELIVEKVPEAFSDEDAAAFVFAHIRSVRAETIQARDAEWTLELGFEGYDEAAAAPNQTPEKIAAQIEMDTQLAERQARAEGERAGREQERERAARIVADYAEKHRRQAQGIVNSYEGDESAVREAESWDREAAQLDRIAAAIRREEDPDA